MLCQNGILTTPPGETGIYFLCQLPQFKNSQCRFVRFCNQTKEYILSTDKNGNSCLYYEIEGLTKKE
jgi:hypothetical protein